jgi:hypothetical protein
MEILFVFLLKASAGIILFYLVYWLFLHKETFYNSNRWFLILALICSVVLPLFPIQYIVLVEPEESTTIVKVLSNSFNNIQHNNYEILEDKGFSWMFGILLAYLTGAVIFLIRLLIQTSILIYLMVKNRVKMVDGIHIVENKKYGLPFSFFNVVFINPKFHKQDDLPEILAHEKVHIRENHWFDLLFIELLTVIFWFNPFIWFFERAIKQNHEYLADKGVILQGHSVGRYQAILLNQLMGMQIIGVTNNLNFALNTNRLKMMTKKKTPKIKWVKFVWTLPVLAMLLFAFAEPNYRAKDTEPQEEVLENETMQTTIKMEGKVTDGNGDPLPGTSVVVKGMAIGTVVDINGTFELEVPENKSIILSFVGRITIEDSFDGITSGYKEGDTYHCKYEMEEDVILIGRAEQLIPIRKDPPPPPPISNGDKEVFYIVEDMPNYPGGSDALNNYAYKMQKKIAEEKDVKGKAKVMFTVNTKGKVSDIKVVEKDNEGAAKGAYIIANEMKDWTPGKQRGKAVPVKYLMPVEFK